MHTNIAQRLNTSLSPCQEIILKTADSSTMQIQGQLNISFNLGPIYGIMRFIVVNRPATDVILGMDFLSKFDVWPRPSKGILEIAGTTSVPFLPERCSPRKICGVSKLTNLNINPSLSPLQRSQLLKVLKAARFATDQIPFGCAIGFEHCIETGDAKPIHQPLRRTAPAERSIVRESVEIMLAQHVIRPSTSPWASPIVLVPKKDGTTRFCVDYRALNDITIKDVFPLPRIDDLLAALSGAKYFSSLDAASGYWQVPMRSADISKTAFICTEGLFEFTVMPFGLCNAPATYQRMMQSILSDLLWKCCFVYIDDILVFGRTFEEHNQALYQVLHRLTRAGIYLKDNKCQFGSRQTEFLGFVVSDEGIHPSPKKVQKLHDYPRPSNVTELRAFIGLGSYYRRFVKDFAKIVCAVTRSDNRTRLELARQT